MRAYLCEKSSKIYSIPIQPTAAVGQAQVESVQGGLGSEDTDYCSPLVLLTAEALLYTKRERERRDEKQREGGGQACQ